MDATLAMIDSNPRISRLARTYTCVPTDAERIHLKSIIFHLELAISRLRAKVFTTLVDNDLIEQISALRTRVDSYKAIIAPIRRIPPELLGEIFIHLEPIDGFPQGKAPVLSASHVCSYWRAVAAELLYLWTAICVNPRTELAANLTPALLETWIRQAKSHPLSLSLVGEHINQQITDFVRSRAVALRHLACWKISPPLYMSLFNQPTAFVAHLELLRIELIEDLSDDLLEPLTDFDTAFESAPCLRQVTFCGALFAVETLQMPWSQLTYLFLQYVMLPQDFTPFIHELVNLEVLALRVNCMSTPYTNYISNPAFPQTTLPHLRSLDLILWSDAMIAPEFFEWVTLPALKELKLDFVERDFFPHFEFNSMHERSNFNLEKFTISHVDMRSGAMARDLLARVSSLLSIEIEEEEESSSSMRRALIYNSKRPLVPLLQEIRVLGARHNFEKTFAKIIESRWWPDDSDMHDDDRPVQRLTFAYLESPERPIDDGTRARLLGYEQQGLELEIEAPCPEWMQLVLDGLLVFVVPEGDDEESDMTSDDEYSEAADEGELDS